MMFFYIACAVYFVWSVPLIYIAVRYMRADRKEKREKAAAAKADIAPAEHPIHVLIDMGPLMEHIDAKSKQALLELQAARQDVAAVMKTTEAIAKAMIDIKNEVVAAQAREKPSPVKSVEEFVTSLLYVRDRFAANATQKKSLDTIISVIKQSHGKSNS